MSGARLQILNLASYTIATDYLIVSLTKIFYSYWYNMVTFRIVLYIVWCTPTRKDRFANFIQLNINRLGKNLKVENFRGFFRAVGGLAM